MPLPRPRTYTNVLPPVTPAGEALPHWRERLSALAEQGSELPEVETFIASIIDEVLAPFKFRRRFLRGDEAQQAYQRGYNATIAEVESIRQEQMRRFVEVP